MKITHKEDYRKLREKEYPSLGDQFDALWKAMDRGELPKIQPFYDDIKAVKDKYPKSIIDDKSMMKSTS